MPLNVLITLRIQFELMLIVFHCTNLRNLILENKIAKFAQETQYIQLGYREFCCGNEKNFNHQLFTSRVIKKINECNLSARLARLRTSETRTCR